jgi:hypothetical protein
MNQLTDNDTVDLVNHAGDDDLEDDNEGSDKADRMSHNEGLNSINITLACIEQQTEATATDVLLFRLCSCHKETEGGSEVNTHY